MSTVRYEPIDEVESLYGYQPGGYQPVQIGDHLHHRYRIVHKLGYGGCSTIWLARDERLSKYVAVKVCAAAIIEHEEADILDRILSQQRKGPGKAFIRPLLDHFRIHGPNGAHTCIVTSPARCSLADSREVSDCGLFQLPVARSFAAQFALAVAYVHDQGYVHGDLHLGNALLPFFKGFENISLEDLYENFGPPEPERFLRVDNEPLPPGVPPYAYPPAWLGISSHYITLSEARLLLSDFGAAFLPRDKTRFQSHTPLGVRPPESFFEPETPLSFPSDVWSLGCVIWAILSQRPFLSSWLFTEDNAISHQIDALGPLPPEWWAKWEAQAKTEMYRDNGVPTDREVWTWDTRFEDGIQKPRLKMDGQLIQEDERDALFEMLRWMLKFRPGDRPSARQILETRWMRDWAIPDCNQAQGLGCW